METSVSPINKTLHIQLNPQLPSLGSVFQTRFVARTFLSMLPSPGLVFTQGGWHPWCRLGRDGYSFGSGVSLAAGMEPGAAVGLRICQMDE